MLIICSSRLFCLCLLLVTFLSSSIYAQSPIASLPVTWRLNESNDHTYTFDGGSILRAILLREAGNLTYACGFYCQANCDTSGYLFSVLIVQLYAPISGIVDKYHKPKVVWSANRNRLVTINALLEFVTGGDLVLKDLDGENAVWSTGTSGISVAGINLTDAGNLLLFDRDNATVWQSFDHPTDTLLRGQKLIMGKKLVPSVSEMNWTEQSLFSFSLTNRGLFAMVGSKPQLSYYSAGSEVSDESYATMVNGTLALFSDYSALAGTYETLYDNPEAVSAQFIRLDHDGHLRAYGFKLGEGFTDMGDVLPLETCKYPTFCGPYGICSGGQCSCPPSRENITYFNPVSFRQPGLGCSPNVPWTCDDSNKQTFQEIGGISYFNFIVDLAGVDVNSCLDACAKNCSCKAVFFSRTPKNSDGMCFLPSEVLSLIDMGDESYQYPYYNYTVYLKVQNAPSKVPSAPNKIPGTKRKKTVLQEVKGVILFAAITFVILSLIAVFFVWRKMHFHEEKEDEWIEQVPGMPTRFSYADLKSITEDFRKKLGEGGFGTVFKGTLFDGTEVAVKRLDGFRHMKKSFLNEVGIIGSIHHLNLVKLLGYCAESSHRLLVYEYMSNGSLDKWIFRKFSASVLNWQQRREIILDIAKGLHYLHEECKEKILHLDIKPQNILLDENLNGKVSDFGLSRLVDRDKSQVMTTVRGTPGYLAPEWLNGLLTEKVDVYSFGVVVLEIVCGRKAFGHAQDQEDVHLLKLFEQKAEEGLLLDLVNDYYASMNPDGATVKDVLRIMRVAAWCLQGDFTRRPSMSTVIKVLEGVMEVADGLVYKFAHPVTTNPNAGVGFHVHAKGSSASTLLSPSVLSGPR